MSFSSRASGGKARGSGVRISQETTGHISRLSRNEHPEFREGASEWQAAQLSSIYSPTSGSCLRPAGAVCCLKWFTSFPPRKKGVPSPSSYPHLLTLPPVSLHPVHPSQILQVQSSHVNKPTGTPISGHLPFPEIIHQHMGRDLLSADRAKNGGHQSLPKY